MKQIVTNGIVLSRINYQDADRILTLLTPDYGKLKAIVKGARRPKSKMAGGIELFSVSQITYLYGKSDIGVLISARLIKHYENIVNSLERTQWSYEILKQINHSTQDEGVSEFYDLLGLTLEALNNEMLPLDLIRLWFGMRYLVIMGHEPNLQVSDSAAGNDNYHFDLEQMKFKAGDGGRYNPNHIKLLRLVLSNEAERLHKIKDIDKLMPGAISLLNSMMVTNGLPVT